MAWEHRGSRAQQRPLGPTVAPGKAGAQGPNSPVSGGPGLVAGAWMMGWSSMNPWVCEPLGAGQSPRHAHSQQLNKGVLEGL